MKRSRAMLFVAGVLMLGALAIYSAWPSGPSYHGRSLQGWVDHYETLENSSSIRDSRGDLEEVEHAIRSMGTNAIPTLLNWLQTPATHSDSRLKDKINAALDKQRYIAFRFQEKYGYDKWWKAKVAFAILGNDAMPAIPALTRLLNSTSDDQQTLTFISIQVIARDRTVLPPIIVQSLQRKDNLRIRAAFYIYETRPEQAEALGVYQILPWLRPSAINLVSTHAPSQSK